MIAKSLEGLGMVVVLTGLVFSMVLGFKEEGLKSMSIELWGLIVGGSLFVIGYLLERGTRA